MTEPTALRSTGFLVALAVLLAGLHALLGLSAAAGKSMTADEIAHLAAGHTYNLLGDFRLQPENGNLPQRWAALPAMLVRPPVAPLASDAWQRADVWNYGHAYFYDQSMPADELLFAGRAMIALFSAATGLLVFGWSRALFGWKGAILSLALFAFCPAFLAHGALATSDVPMTFFFLASVGAWWRQLEQPGLGGCLLSALIFGLACVTKFSAVLLPVMFVPLAITWLAGQVRASGWRQPLGRLARSTLLHLGVAWMTIWLFYCGRFSAFAPGLPGGSTFYRGDWPWILSDIGWLGSPIVALRDWHVLPEAFLYGFAFVVQFARERSAFLNGEYSLTGWPSFFPFAFLVKTTVPLLLLVLVGLIAWVRQRGSTGVGGGKLLLRQTRVAAPLLALFTVYWSFSLTSHLNIGHRHLLPIYPVLFILLGAFGGWIDWRRPRTLLVLGLTVWHLGESLRIRPHYLAYFNELVGGPRNGWRHLVDSSLDWGQDLPELAAWLKAHPPGEKVYFSYFGAGNPAREGIRATLLPTLPAVGPPRPWHSLEPGIYAISATMLSGVYNVVGGTWNAKLEREYQELRPLENTLLDYARHPEKQAEYERGAPAAKWRATWNRFEQLRFARLCYYLRTGQPDAMAGYSILIFRLSKADLDAALNGPASDLAGAIERKLTPSLR